MEAPFTCRCDALPLHLLVLTICLTPFCSPAMQVPSWPVPTLATKLAGEPEECGKC